MAWRSPAWHQLLGFAVAQDKTSPDTGYGGRAAEYRAAEYRAADNLPVGGILPKKLIQIQNSPANSLEDGIDLLMVEVLQYLTTSSTYGGRLVTVATYA